MLALTDLGHASHRGMKRSVNQDSYCALAWPDAPAGLDALLAVADGMGGHAAGEIASRMAIEGLVEKLAHLGQTTAECSTTDNVSIIEDIVHSLNRQIRSRASAAETRGMGTTLTAGIICKGMLSVAHVGDSRAYLLRGDELRQLTQDHTWVAEQVASGAIPAERARSHPRRNILTRALGIDIGNTVDCVSLGLEAKDTLLMCSDGLHSLVSDEVIRRTMSEATPQEASDYLVSKANSLGGDGNITVIVARIGHRKTSK